MNRIEKITGIIPAAGFARRISPLPCSKEIYPIGFEFYDQQYNQSPKVVSSSLLKQFKDAGLKEVYFIIRKGKWDIPDYFGTGSDFNMNIAYLVTEPTPGTPHTIDKAFHFIKDKHILFGFPDIVIDANNPFEKLLKKQNESAADVTVGLFEADSPRKVDMVETDNQGMLKNIIIKPDKTDLTHTWLLAVWSPVFTKFLHDTISKHQVEIMPPQKKETYVGDIILASIQAGMKVATVKFQKSTFTDIGTIEDLRRVIKDNV